MIYILIVYLYVVILYFLVLLFLGGYYPRVFLPGRVWVWDKIYTHVRVRVRVVGKILGHGCGFG
jgi:hypothetical protein